MAATGFLRESFTLSIVFLPVERDRGINYTWCLSLMHPEFSSANKDDPTTNVYIGRLGFVFVCNGFKLIHVNIYLVPVVTEQSLQSRAL